MLKTTTTKIFFAFALVILTVTGTLFWLFGSFFLNESEAYFLEAALQNSRREARDVEDLILAERSLYEIAEQRPVVFLSETAVIASEAITFSKDYLQEQKPARGSKITRCQDLSGVPYICAFQPLQVRDLILFSAYQPPTMEIVLTKFSREVWWPIVLIFLFGLGLAFSLSRSILRPLTRFSKAAGEVAQGNYRVTKLPTSRGDEVGQFARAFERMMTDLQSRERSLAETGIRLAHSERLATIGQMGAGIAHEIKNPLTSMIGYAKILKSKTTEPEMQEASQIIVQEAERCSNILSQILRFSRSQPEDKKPYALKDVIESSWVLLKAEAKKKQISLKKELQAEPIVRGSPQLLQQVILNLVINAIHASEAGSVVTIRLSEVEDQAMIEIIDRGTGIPLDLQDKIFDAFFTTKEDDEGTGLGLAVASEMVREQGGRLDLDSTPGKGTTFTITLGLADDSDAVQV